MTREEKETYLAERLARIVIHSGALGNEYRACEGLFQNKKLGDIVRRGVQCHVRLAEELRDFSSNTPEFHRLMHFAEHEPSYLLSEIVDVCTGMPESFLNDVLAIVKAHKAGELIVKESENT